MEGMRFIYYWLTLLAFLVVICNAMGPLEFKLVRSLIPEMEPSFPSFPSYVYKQLTDSETSAVFDANIHRNRNTSTVYDELSPTKLALAQRFKILQDYDSHQRAPSSVFVNKRMTSPSPPVSSKLHQLHIDPNLTYSIVKDSGKPCFPMDSCERPDLLALLTRHQTLNYLASSSSPSSFRSFNDIDDLFSSHKRLKNCECDTQCQVYGDCCADYPVFAANMVKMIASLDPNFTKIFTKNMSKTLSKQASKFSCNHVTGLYDIYVIDSCPAILSSTAKTVKRERYGQLVSKCERLDDFSDPLTFVPYTDSRTNFTYRNMWCALCHETVKRLNYHETRDKKKSLNYDSLLEFLIPWSSTIHCNFVPTGSQLQSRASTVNTHLDVDAFLGRFLNENKANFRLDDVYHKYLIWEFPEATTTITLFSRKRYCWWKFSHPSMTIITSSRSSAASSYDPIMNEGWKRRRKDIVAPHPPINHHESSRVIGVRKCVPHLINSCDRTRPLSNLSYNSILSGSSSNGGSPTLEDIEVKCKSYTALVYSFGGRVYKNAHCALCNADITSLSDLSCYDIFSSPSSSDNELERLPMARPNNMFDNDAKFSKSRWFLTPSSLYTWKQVDSHGNIADPVRNCDLGNVWNPFTGKCTKAHYCGITYKYANSMNYLSTCSPMDPQEILELSTPNSEAFDDEEAGMFNYGSPLIIINSTDINNQNIRFQNSFGHLIECLDNERTSWLPGTYNLDRRAFPSDLVYVPPKALQANGIKFNNEKANQPMILNPGDFYFDSSQNGDNNWPSDASFYMITKRHEQNDDLNISDDRSSSTSGSRADSLIRLLAIKKSDLRNLGLYNRDVRDVNVQSKLINRLNPNVHEIYVCHKTLLEKGARIMTDSPVGSGPARHVSEWSFVCNRKRVISYLALILSAALFLSVDILALFTRLLEKWNSISSVAASTASTVIAKNVPYIWDTGCLLTCVHALESACLNFFLIFALFYFHNSQSLKNLLPSPSHFPSPGGQDLPQKDRPPTYYDIRKALQLSSKVEKYKDSMCDDSLFKYLTGNIIIGSTSASSLLNETSVDTLDSARAVSLIKGLIADNGKINSNFSTKFLQPFIMFFIFSNLLWITAFSLNRFFNALLNYRKYFVKNVRNDDKSKYPALIYPSTVDIDEERDLTTGSRSVFGRKYTSYDIWDKRLCKGRPWTRYAILQFSIWVSATLLMALFYTSLSSGTAIDKQTGGSGDGLKKYGFLTITLPDHASNVYNSLSVSPITRYLFYGRLDFSSRYNHLDGKKRPNYGSLNPFERSCESCTCLPPINPFFGLAFLVPLTIVSCLAASALTIFIIALNHKVRMAKQRARLDDNVNNNNNNEVQKRSTDVYCNKGRVPTCHKENTAHSSSSNSSSAALGTTTVDMETGDGSNDSKNELLSASGSCNSNNPADSYSGRSSFDLERDQENPSSGFCSQSDEVIAHNSSKGISDGSNDARWLDRACCFVGLTDFFTLLLIALTFIQYSLLGASSTVFSNNHSSHYYLSYLSGNPRNANDLPETSYRDNSCTLFWILFLVITNFKALTFFSWCCFTARRRGHRSNAYYNNNNANDKDKNYKSNKRLNFKNYDEGCSIYVKCGDHPNNNNKGVDDLEKEPLNSEQNRVTLTKYDYQRNHGTPCYNFNVTALLPPSGKRRGTYNVYKREKLQQKASAPPTMSTSSSGTTKNTMKTVKMKIPSRGSNVVIHHLVSQDSGTESNPSPRITAKASLIRKWSPNKLYGPKSPVRLVNTTNTKKAAHVASSSSSCPGEPSNDLIHSNHKTIGSPTTKNKPHYDDTRYDKFMELALSEEKAKLHSVREIEIV